MIKVKRFLVRFSIFLLMLSGTACVFNAGGGSRSMSEAEKYVAKKYKAEQVRATLQRDQSVRNGESTESELYIFVSLENPEDIEKILSDKDYCHQRGDSIVTFVLDSLNFGEQTAQATEIRIEFVQKSKGMVTKTSSKQLTYPLVKNEEE